MSDDKAATCGHTVTDEDGVEEPCGRVAVGWRWYQDVAHEDCLERACSFHENEGGRRLHAAGAERDALRAKVAVVETLAVMGVREQWPPDEWRVRLLSAVGNATPTEPTREATECRCTPCPGRGNDGHGLTHCAECCFGSGVVAEIDCPTHGAAREAAEDGADHIGRSFEGHQLEDSCPCKKARCGLAVATSDPTCREHSFQAAKTIRQSHRAQDCPARKP